MLKQGYTAAEYSRWWSTGKNAQIILGVPWNSEMISPVTQMVSGFVHVTLFYYKKMCSGLLVWPTYLS
jgi:hypothetical protein